MKKILIMIFLLIVNMISAVCDAKSILCCNNELVINLPDEYFAATKAEIKQNGLLHEKKSVIYFNSLREDVFREGSPIDLFALADDDAVTIVKYYVGKEVAAKSKDDRKISLMHYKLESDTVRKGWESYMIDLAEGTNTFPGFSPKRVSMQEINGNAFTSYHLVSKKPGDSKTTFTYATETTNYVVQFNFILLKKNDDFNEIVYLEKIHKILNSIVLL